MEGVASTLARLTEIQARMAVFAPATATRSTAATSPSISGASFEQALAAATGTADPTGTSALTPAKKLSPGAYGRLEPPSELTAYGNGRIPESRLRSIGTGDHKLYAPAADAFTKMSAAAKRDGVTIGVNDSYRDFGEQQAVARQKGLYSQGGLAAAPGTSTHGWGLSVDLQLDGRAQQWMRENGWRHGYVEDVAREPWHWTYRPT